MLAAGSGDVVSADANVGTVELTTPGTRERD
jgi:hypothetical protein